MVILIGQSSLLIHLNLCLKCFYKTLPESRYALVIRRGILMLSIYFILNQFKDTFMKTKLLPLVAVISLAFAAGAHAHSHGGMKKGDIMANGTNAYAVDYQGRVVRDSLHRCVRSSRWTKETAIAACEGWVVEKPKPKPVPKPAPVVVPKPEPKPAPVVVPKPIPKPAPVVVPKPEPKPIPELPAPLAFQGNFTSNGAGLAASSTNQLDGYVEYLKAKPKAVVKVVGHTDSIGKAAYNKTLSKKRADAVKNYLMSQGIGEDQILTSGMGETSPVADNATKEGRKQNRRVEVEIIK